MTWEVVSPQSKAQPQPLDAARRPVPHLFGRFDKIRKRLRSASRVAFLLDFDGTLAPIRPRPEQVSLDGSTGQTLARLALHPRVRIWIISGRQLAVLRRLADIKGVKYLGLHGWEGRHHRPLPASSQRTIHRAKKRFQSALAGVPGVWIEDKGPVFVVHYRQAGSGDVSRAWRIVQELMHELGDAFRLVVGKKIWEIFPPEVKGKGEAARSIASRQPAGTLVIYLGDDTTDEEAFRALPRALTVRVGRTARTNANFRLRNPVEVRQFLRRIEKGLA
ncbi:MAG TPA: trehalose-phosphatase [Terriglobia bacterium]